MSLMPPGFLAEFEPSKVGPRDGPWGLARWSGEVCTFGLSADFGLVVDCTEPCCVDIACLAGVTFYSEPRKVVWVSCSSFLRLSWTWARACFCCDFERSLRTS